MALMSLANHCKELVTLECAGVSQFTDAGFQVGTIKMVELYVHLL